MCCSVVPTLRCQVLVRWSVDLNPLLESTYSLCSAHWEEGHNLKQGPMGLGLVAFANCYTAMACNLAYILKAVQCGTLLAGIISVGRTCYLQTGMVFILA